ncbi:hypothetical protein [Jidongwangia harbinensis]|nr:hypothetical protein [Jidongwangia harbinensis]MCA2219073.1 hypothetical protein [Jidongwangia harbinensis]
MAGPCPPGERGLILGLNRRTPGPRREDRALIAGVSEDYIPPAGRVPGR